MCGEMHLSANPGTGGVRSVAVPGYSSAGTPLAQALPHTALVARRACARGRARSRVKAEVLCAGRTFQWAALPSSAMDSSAIAL